MYRDAIPTGRYAEAKFPFPEVGNIDPDAPRREKQEQLAKLITSPRNGLFARTIVNRLWARFFGRGLVEPLDEMANDPWHRELLDWLAADLIEHDFDLNRILCRGAIEASSESLTHASFYEASRSINAVIHIHHKELWQKYLNKLPTTSLEVEYGTPEMALEVLRLLKHGPRPAKQLVIMGGHDEGVMAYGSSLGHAASILLNCCDRMFRPLAT